MPKVTDIKLSAIIDGAAGGLPRATATKVFHLARLLLASHSLDDVSVYCDPTPGAGERFIVQVTGKWGVSFSLDDDGAPTNLSLEKLGKSWHEP